MMDAIQRAVPVQAEVIMHGASGRLGSARHWRPQKYITPLITSRIASAFAAAGLARRDQRLVRHSEAANSLSRL